MNTARIIQALRNPSSQVDVNRMIDEEVGSLVERIVTAGRNIRLVRQHVFDFVHAIYVHAARGLNTAALNETNLKLDAAHDRAEAFELYQALERAFRELDKIRFGGQPDPSAIVVIGEELSKFERPIRYGRDDQL